MRYKIYNRHQDEGWEFSGKESDSLQEIIPVFQEMKNNPMSWGMVELRESNKHGECQINPMKFARVIITATCKEKGMEGCLLANSGDWHYIVLENGKEFQCWATHHSPSCCGNCDNCLNGCDCLYHGPWCYCPLCQDSRRKTDQRLKEVAEETKKDEEKFLARHKKDSPKTSIKSRKPGSFWKKVKNFSKSQDIDS